MPSDDEPVDAGDLAGERRSAPVVDEGPLRLDPRRSTFITIWGRKGSGKSELGLMFWLSYPYDRVVIDPTGDVGPRLPDDAYTDLRPPLPSRWPEPMRVGDERARSSLRYEPDPGSPTHDIDVDTVVGMAFFHPRRRSALLVDEIDTLSTSGQSTAGPNTHRMLKQGRHRGLTLITCGIRPMNVNPLFLSQSDYVAVFSLPNPDDRKRVAASIGVEPGEFDDMNHELGEHEFLWCDVASAEIVLCPKLPLGRRQ